VVPPRAEPTIYVRSVLGKRRKNKEKNKEETTNKETSKGNKKKKYEAVCSVGMGVAYLKG